MNQKIIDMLANSGYDFNYQIEESHILSLMQQAYNLDRTPSHTGGIRTAEEVYKQHPAPDEYWYPNRAVVELQRKAYENGISQSTHNQFAGQGWISVEDRLPEDDEEYNVVMDLEDGEEPISSTLEFDAITKAWLYPGTEINAGIVTHWQPLPSPPQNTKES